MSGHSECFNNPNQRLRTASNNTPCCLTTKITLLFSPCCPYKSKMAKILMCLLSLLAVPAMAFIQGPHTAFHRGFTPRIQAHSYNVDRVHHSQISINCPRIQNAVLAGLRMTSSATAQVDTLPYPRWILPAFVDDTILVFVSGDVLQSKRKDHALLIC
jgi:hypothetical protein